MHLGISYKATFPEAPINAFKSEVEAPGLEVFVEKTPANEIYAGLEWLLPTAAVVYITKSYFDSFLKEMGKDHYAILKKALKNAGHFFLRADRSLYIISTKGKIAPSRPFSHSFSIMAEVRPRVALKLLLQTGISESDFGEALEAFCDILNDIQHGNLMMAKIKGFDGNWPQRGIVLTAFNLEEKALEIVDPSSSAHRRKV